MVKTFNNQYEQLARPATELRQVSWCQEGTGTGPLVTGLWAGGKNLLKEGLSGQMSTGSRGL